MKLTDGEKLALLMLADIYETTGTKGEMEPGFIRAAIIKDQTWAIRWRYSGIPFGRREANPVLDKVVQVVEMWANIEDSYDALAQSAKDRVAEEAKPFGRDAKFPGFDGNNEAEYRNTARFLVNEAEAFPTFKGRDLNSHAPLMDAYDRMFSAYDKVRHGRLSADQLVRILKEMIHPENRT